MSVINGIMGWRAFRDKAKQMLAKNYRGMRRTIKKTLRLVCFGFLRRRKVEIIRGYLGSF